MLLCGFSQLMPGGGMMFFDLFAGSVMIRLIFMFCDFANKMYSRQYRPLQDVYDTSPISINPAQLDESSSA